MNRKLYVLVLVVLFFNNNFSLAMNNELNTLDVFDNFFKDVAISTLKVGAGAAIGYFGAVTLGEAMCDLLQFCELGLMATGMYESHDQIAVQSRSGFKQMAKNQLLYGEFVLLSPNKSISKGTLAKLILGGSSLYVSHGLIKDALNIILK